MEGKGRPKPSKKPSYRLEPPNKHSFFVSVENLTNLECLDQLSQTMPDLQSDVASSHTP